MQKVWDSLLLSELWHALEFRSEHVKEDEPLNPVLCLRLSIALPCRSFFSLRSLDVITAIWQV